MNKPLQPLRWQQPYEPSQLERIAGVIEKIVMAQEAQKKLLDAHSYRWPATKEQYEALTKFNKIEAIIVSTDDPDYGPQNFFTP